MPDEKDPASGEEDGYRTDVVSRNDGEGLPGPDEPVPDPDKLGPPDTFSRNDEEGLSAANEEADSKPPR